MPNRVDTWEKRYNRKYTGFYIDSIDTNSIPFHQFEGYGFYSYTDSDGNLYEREGFFLKGKQTGFGRHTAGRRNALEKDKMHQLGEFKDDMLNGTGLDNDHYGRF